MANDARQQLPQSTKQVVVIEDDGESQARRSESNRESDLSRQRHAWTQAPPLVTAGLETAGLQEACVADDPSLHMNVKLEPDSQLDAPLHSQLDAPLHSQLDAPLRSQLDAPLHSPASPSQFTYLSGTNPSPQIDDLPGTKPSPKRTCIAEPDKYRSKKRGRKAQMLRATIDCVFGLWEKDMQNQ